MVDTCHAEFNSDVGGSERRYCSHATSDTRTDQSGAPLRGRRGLGGWGWVSQRRKKETAPSSSSPATRVRWISIEDTLRDNRSVNESLILFFFRPKSRGFLPSSYWVDKIPTGRHCQRNRNRVMPFVFNQSLNEFHWIFTHNHSYHPFVSAISSVSFLGGLVEFHFDGATVTARAIFVFFCFSFIFTETLSEFYGILQCRWGSGWAICCALQRLPLTESKCKYF